ncbi:MAG: hypothetical protein EBX52_02810 [Proteobacteria bacterium]|nr:hypothetical protein [Pseudomonadota bacterium]
MAVALYKWHSEGWEISAASGYRALGAIDALFMVHYYLESVTWKFSNEHVRKTILPLLAAPKV